MESARKVVAAVLVLSVALAGLQLAGVLGPSAAVENAVKAARVTGALPATDPAAEAWGRAKPFEVPLSAQVSVAPFRPTPLAPSLTVRALVNDTHAAFKITWADPTLNNRTTRDREFRDAVAVMFAPVGSLPVLCMGAPGVRQQIAQWKADWQADLDEGFRDLQDAYPNFWVDMYPYAIGGPPYALPEAFANYSKTYLPGWYVGNPFSEPLKVTAVEEASAEGFGTIATQEHQDAVGRGVHSGSGWDVVISRPLSTADPDDVPLESGTTLAFAVWDGASGDVGGRKSVSSFLTLEVPALSEEVDWIPGAILLVLVLGIAAAFSLQYRKKPPKEPAKPAKPAAKAPARPSGTKTAGTKKPSPPAGKPKAPEKEATK